MEKITAGAKPTLNLKKIYNKYKNCLKGAKKGQVVTRFPPEPSGYLHIGHVKAVFLNYHYSKIFEGSMILRFDDTNPAKESQEFIDNIISDLNTLEVYPDKVTYTSDSFDIIADFCTKMITEGNAYCDNTPTEKMRHERREKIASEKRDTTTEENLAIWEEMKLGTELGQTYCVRAKLSFNNKNGCLRDPVMYRYVDHHHPRTGDKWKVYPTYDFACPIVDSIEGVTYAMRTTEYNDRKDQFKWFIKKLGLRKVNIKEYSRLSFVNTIISKRYLKRVVDDGLVSGWTDPRFPTVQAILRRGMLLPTLVEFMLDQGPSRNNNLQEWDKVWGLNAKKLEQFAGKYKGVLCEKLATLTVTNVADTVETKEVPVSKKNKSLGNRLQYLSNKFFLCHDDAVRIKEGDRVTLMDYMIVKITKVTQPEDPTQGIILEAESQPEDKDWGTTQKMTWCIGDKSLLSKVQINEYEHLLTKAKLADGDKLEDFLNRNSKHETAGLADPDVKTLALGTHLQLQRIGNFRVDSRHIDDDGNTVTVLILIPTGKSSFMSDIKLKVDPKMIAKGGDLC